MTTRHTSPQSRPFIVIAGPTASGKSALAIDIARKCDGVIINADSMQIYRDLHVLTARPHRDEMGGVSHLLYGVVEGRYPCSVGQWLERATEAAEQVWQAGQTPIMVGGTGMYLDAALNGISAIPDIPQSVRAQVTSERQEIGADAFYDKLVQADPVLAAKLYPTDTQRVLRAMEVVRHTQIPLSSWQKKPRTGQLNGQSATIAYLPPRDALYQNIERRFDAMVEKGAVDEVRLLLEQQLDVNLPVMKALGVGAFAEYLRGACTLSEAIELAKRDTRRYAKRQITWIRNNFISNIEVNELYSKSICEKIFPKIF